VNPKLIDMNGATINFRPLTTKTPNILNIPSCAVNATSNISIAFQNQ
jgi:hypothetical protein